MNEESKKPVVCPMPKPHPTAVMKKTLNFVREEKMPFEEARERAKKECVEEGKFHGVSKMAYDYCCIANDLEKEQKGK
jgi:hypothetical protein